MTAAAVLRGEKPDVAGLADRLALILTPHLQRQAMAGLRQGAQDARASMGNRSFIEQSTVPDPNKFRQEALELAQDAAREWAGNAARDLKRAVSEVVRDARRALKRGELKPTEVRGALIDATIGFRDPGRAKLVVEDQGTRMQHQGRGLLNQTAGAWGKEWVTSFRPTTCKVCRKLHGKVVRMDKPFWVNPAGGPYAVVMFPTIHPWCGCGWKPVWRKPR